jgi:hypothetical protein
MVEEIQKLRLFVVGEFSPDPADWSEYGGYSLVLAGDQDEAVRASSTHGAAIEVSGREACELIRVKVRDA